MVLSDPAGQDWAASKPYRDGESVRMILIMIVIISFVICFSFDDDHEDWAVSKPYRVGEDYDYSENDCCHFDDCWEI